MLQCGWILENIILSEIRQAQNNISYNSIYREVRNRQSYRHRKWVSGSPGMERGVRAKGTGY